MIICAKNSPLDTFFLLYNLNQQLFQGATLKRFFNVSEAQSSPCENLCKLVGNARVTLSRGFFVKLIMCPHTQNGKFLFFLLRSMDGGEGELEEKACDFSIVQRERKEKCEMKKRIHSH